MLNLKFILLAHDINVLYAGRSITEVNNLLLNNELKQMNRWFKVK